VEPLFDGSIEGFDLGGSVACCLWVEVHDVAVGGVELEIDVAELVEALDEHACSDQQHKS
jgi:hypothetical protein